MPSPNKPSPNKPSPNKPSPNKPSPNKPIKAKSVADYLARLPADRRAAIDAVRAVILKNLGKGFEEGLTYGMIGYYVPHSLFPAGYHCDPTMPLPFAGLASQKNHMSLYLNCSCGDVDAEWFQKAWAKSGKKLDMGKSCIRFKKVDDLALDVIGEAIRRQPVKRYIEQYIETLDRTAKTSPAERRTAAKKAVVKKISKRSPPVTAKAATKRA